MPAGVRAALVLLGVGMLAACGGSGPGAAGGGGGTTVSTLSASGLRYNTFTTVTVNGSGLDQNIQLDGGEHCTDLTRLGLGTEAQQSFQCRTIRVGEYNFRVRDANGRQLATLLVLVPAPQVTLTTARGAIVVELDVPQAPVASNNFLSYALTATPFYASTIFHRLEAGVGITGGVYTFTSNTVSAKANTRAAVALENSGLKNLRGTVALVPETAGALTGKSAFVINLRDNPANDRVSDSQPGTVVFGRVVSGLDLADTIGNDPVQPFIDPASGFFPTTPVSITAASQSR